MTDKILFWLDQHLKQFCLSYYLQKEITAKIFAIIDITNNPRNFFETQNLVDFEKTWFFHDYVLPENKVDFDKRTYTDPQFAGPPNTYTA